MRYAFFSPLISYFGLNDFCGTSKGRLCRVVDAAGTPDYKYNALGAFVVIPAQTGIQFFTAEARRILKHNGHKDHNAGGAFVFLAEGGIHCGVFVLYRFRARGQRGPRPAPG